MARSIGAVAVLQGWTLSAAGSSLLGLGSTAHPFLELTGNHRYRDGFNSWCKSWCQVNPVNGGCNWLRGQEASIRLPICWQLADAPAQLPDFRPQRAFVATHLQRIAAASVTPRCRTTTTGSQKPLPYPRRSWLAAFASTPCSLPQTVSRQTPCS